jgi:hypothetical protein
VYFLGERVVLFLFMGRFCGGKLGERDDDIERFWSLAEKSSQFEDLLLRFKG